MNLLHLIFYMLFSLLPLALPSASDFQTREVPVTRITLKAVAGLQYDLVRIRIRPGSKVELVLRNDDDMSHNLVITKPGTRIEVVNAAMKLEEKGPAMNFIPNTPDVLWSIPVLAPGEEKSVVFTAPDKPGVYPYVCTFPGHGFSMYGALYVTLDENLPDLKTDPNIPEPRRHSSGSESANKAKEDNSHVEHAITAHPYALKPPYLYRVYMEDASPAAIAVHLPQGLSYCWDAATCELRYAWEGGFIDNTGVWKGKPNAVAKILGDVFFRIKSRHPLRTGNGEAVPLVAYKGYRLLDRYPEFHYTLNGLDVYELIKPSETGDGLIRTFRIPEATGDIVFYMHPEDGVRYKFSTGEETKNRILISGGRARQFTVIMTKKEK